MWVFSPGFISVEGEWASGDDKVYYYPRQAEGEIEYLADYTTFITAENSDNIIISGIEFSKTLGNAINLKNCKNSKIENCTFKNITDSAIVLNNCNSSSVYNCDFNENGSNGIVINGDSCTIDNCGFENNAVLHITDSYPVLIEGNNNSVTRCDFTHSSAGAICIKGNENIVSSCDISNAIERSGNGCVFIRNGSSQNIIKNNYFYDIERNVAERNKIVVTENTVLSQSGRLSLAGSTDVNPVNDEYKQDISRGISTFPSAGIYLEPESSGTEISQNVFYATDFGINSVSSDGNNITYNVFITNYDYLYMISLENPDTEPENNSSVKNIFCGKEDIGDLSIRKTNTFDNIKVFESNITDRFYNLNTEAIREKLPEFENLNIEEIGRYEVQETESVFDSGIVLVIGSDNVSARGVISKIDASARIVDGRTLVPVRYISESFGEKVGWDDETKTVTVGDSVSITLGQPSITVNGSEQAIDVPAAIYDSRTFVPLRAIAEALGKSVFWDDRGLIVITDNPTEITAEEATGLIDKLK